MNREIFIKIYRLLNRRDRRFLVALLCFSLFVSLIEIAGVALIMPFLSIATDFDAIHRKWYFQSIYEFFDFQSEYHFVIAFGLILLVFYLFRSMINYLYFHLLARFSKGRYYVVALKLFKNYLQRSYLDFILSSKAELTKVLIVEGQNMMLALSSFLFMISELFVVLFIYVILLWIDWEITLAITLFLMANFLFLLLTVSKKIKQAGKAREMSEKNFHRVLRTVLGNFKMIKLRDAGDLYYEKFKQATGRFAHSKIVYESLREIPRLYLEATGFVIVISIILYYLITTGKNVTPQLPLISVFILALYRLLPSFHRLLGAYNNILYNYRAIEMIHDEILYPMEQIGTESIRFCRNISLRDIHFSYISGKPVLQGVDLDLSKREKIGIIGKSGSGKSTLIDILIGLYRPSKGTIEIDGTPLHTGNMQSWRKKIGYIPQKIELMEGSVAYNVALNEEYDIETVKQALKRAELYQYLEEKHEGIFTVIGEDGINLSGGQRQRLAIARALYHDPEILVLDEATSALDLETERKIMTTLQSIGQTKTMIIVTHRAETLHFCDTIYRLEKGRLERIQ